MDREMEILNLIKGIQDLISTIIDQQAEIIETLQSLESKEVN